MPELPEVETVRLGLNQVTLAQKIWGGDVLLARSIAHPLSVGDFLAGMKNVTILNWHRRGKYLLAQLTKSDASNAGWLGVHLRMTGQLLWLDRDQPLQKHTRVRLFFPEHRELRFVDTRTFGKMWWVPPLETPETIITGLKKLGPEPFGDDFSVEYLASKLKKRQRAIKTALLDQGLVAGVGNIYADEALFLSGIRPETPCAALNVEQIKRLRLAVIEVLQKSIEVGGTTFSNFLNVQGVNGNYSGVAWVYGRTGQHCRVCGTLIENLKLAGRSSHFCPRCQH
ncbi:MAG: DNA-formamidopyrimidine glycosylase [Symploca sp. SIO3C6]|uniref:Formamidopyrimidine-DNA glycosylase n=1 Tax=Symploca sp. SIO1C4 TaxID=2607765 RepID=A0A6B3NE13_9CYAN|nr:DNA-formamidopyrimidine glycosylase [Symploca sp. SIO3C6]NER28374.1 DNA-formamidopyrimidine glycosylase [Symploca sp. SIO1C4]NET03876.1 DNA-formamidopyrimidine glycosylase [Symploca sp. SIO2B6]NET51743.1 DNA-formamidopyrimidine glycosylase [Merismopedia sp. SIO2A8]